MAKAFLIFAIILFSFLAISSVKQAKADVSIEITCGCGTASPTPTLSPSPTPTLGPTNTPQPTNPPSFEMPGAPVCGAMTPNNPVITSVNRKPTSATVNWTKVDNADHYLIFYGPKPGSQEFGVPNTGNVTSFTINFLDPKLKYYFDVRAVNDCAPSKGGQVLGASTTVLAATDSDLELPRILLGIIATGVSFFAIKKFTI